MVVRKLECQTMPVLQAKAKARGVPYSGKSKAQLIASLRGGPGARPKARGGRTRVRAVAAPVAAPVVEIIPVPAVSRRRMPAKKIPNKPRAPARKNNRGGITPSMVAGRQRYQNFMATKKAGGMTHKQALAAWRGEKKNA